MCWVHPHLCGEGHTAVSKALIGPRDQIMRSGSRHFGTYVTVRMIVTFLIDPSMIEVSCDWFVRFIHNSWRHPVTRPTIWSHTTIKFKILPTVVIGLSMIRPHPMMWARKGNAEINGYRYSRNMFTPHSCNSCCIAYSFLRSKKKSFHIECVYTTL